MPPLSGASTHSLSPPGGRRATLTTVSGHGHRNDRALSAHVRTTAGRTINGSNRRTSAPDRAVYLPVDAGVVVRVRRWSRPSRSAATAVRAPWVSARVVPDHRTPSMEPEPSLEVLEHTHGSPTACPARLPALSALRVFDVFPMDPPRGVRGVADPGVGPLTRRPRGPHCPGAGRLCRSGRTPASEFGPRDWSRSASGVAGLAGTTAACGRSWCRSSGRSPE